MIHFLHLRQPSLTTRCLCPPRVLTKGTLLYFIFKITLLQYENIPNSSLLQYLCYILGLLQLDIKAIVVITAGW